MHNDFILSVAQGGFSGARYDEVRVWIFDTSIIKYIPKHINTTSNRNNITCGYYICISDMLLQYYLNKLLLRNLDFLKRFISMPHQLDFYQY